MFQVLSPIQFRRMRIGRVMKSVRLWRGHLLMTDGK